MRIFEVANVESVLYLDQPPSLSQHPQSLTPGLTIQRKSHVQDEALPIEQRTRAVRRPLWIIGFAIYISSNIFGSGALPPQPR